MSPVGMHRWSVLALAALALAILASAALARADEGYDLSWFTVDGGGGSSSGGTYALSGTVGQWDAGVSLYGGEYGLVGGFWSGVGSRYPIYLPIVLKQ